MVGNYLECSMFARSYLNDNTSDHDSVKALYEDVFRKALYEIGELWEFNKISVATEHLASAIVESIQNELYNELALSNKSKRNVIISCIENEYHQIGLKMINDLFEMNGWNTHFLGSNTPIKELIEYSKKMNPDLVAVSLSIYFNLPLLEKFLQLAQKDIPDIPILVGGQAFRHGGHDVLTKYKNVIYKPDLESTEEFIKKRN